jgi:hypothetical protein
LKAATSGEIHLEAPPSIDMRRGTMPVLWRISRAAHFKLKVDLT